MLKLNKAFFVYLYLILTIIITITYAFLKCYQNFTALDDFFYIEMNFSELTTESVVKYILYHVVSYMILGFMFTNKHFISNSLQTILIELILASVKNCNPKELYKKDVVFTAAVSILSGIISYYIGGVIRNYTYP